MKNPKQKERNYSRKPRLVLRTRQRMSRRMIFAASGVFIILTTLGLAFYFQFAKVEKANAATAGDYRSAATGAWGSTSTWQYYNGTTWGAAPGTPSGGSYNVEISAGDTVTVAANVSTAQTVVDASGTLVIAPGKTLTVSNGTGTDLTVNGTLTMYGNISEAASSTVVLNGKILQVSGGHNTFGSSASITINNGGLYQNQDGTITTTAGIWAINSGGTYQHDVDVNTLPLATWNTGSTCLVTGVKTNVPGNLTQNFYHFTYNCPNQTATINMTGKLTTINGDFTFVSSGTGSLRLSQPETFTLAIGGNLNMQGGNLYTTSKGVPTINIIGNYNQTGGYFGGTDETKDNGTGTPVITVSGTFNISSGTFDMTQNNATGNGNGISTLNLNGNFIQTGGTITETAPVTSATYGYGDIYFKKSGTQTFSKTGGTISNSVNFTVNSTSTLNLGSSIITGAGNFTALNGSTLSVSDPNGLTGSSGSGNVQVTGTRTFSNTANYTFSGSTAQSTGSGVPATVNNITVNNSSGVTLTNSVSVSGTLTITGGNITTGANTLTLGTSTSTLGTLALTSGQIVGNFSRWVAASTASNILFPVGDGVNNQSINYSFTSAPSAGGTITVTPSTANPGTNGFPLTDAGDNLVNIGVYYWTAVAGNGLTGGTFSVNATAANLPGVADYTALHLVTRTSPASVWTINGTQSAGTGSNSTPVVNRTAMTAFGQYGIGSNSGNVLPIELLYFTPALNPSNSTVDLNWATASEINNDFFTIERANAPDLSDGSNLTWQTIGTVQGAGNSTVELKYHLTDDSPFSSGTAMDRTLYYRLKQTDYDGKFVYFPVKSVTTGVANSASNVAIQTTGPNPFKDHFKIVYTTSTQGALEIQITNYLGQLVYKETVNTEKGYNIYSFSDKIGLEPGVYFVNMITNETKITQKLIKQ